jgi:hypothetical protein
LEVSIFQESEWKTICIAIKTRLDICGTKYKRCSWPGNMKSDMILQQHAVSKYFGAFYGIYSVGRFAIIGCACCGKSSRIHIVMGTNNVCFCYHCTCLSLFTFCSDVTLSGRFIFSYNEWLFFKTVITYTELQCVNFDSVEILF